MRHLYMTEREDEVYALVARGLSNKEIAREMGISERTVKSYLTIIMMKLCVTNRVQAALKYHGIESDGKKQDDEQ